MKNNFLSFLIIFIFLSQNVIADQFKFETKKIEIVDSGNIIYAKNGTAKSLDGLLKIIADDFEYNKSLNSLKAFNGVAFIESNNLEIKFDKAEFDQNNLMALIRGNVKIFEKEKNLIIETESVHYDQNSNILSSSTESILKDKNNNILNTNSFEYNKNKNILKIKKAILKDFNQNTYHIDLAYINTESNKLFGKDINISLNNEYFNKDNEPRLKGMSLVQDELSTEITKGVFTTCKKRDDCPPWQMSAEKIQHNKKKQVISYKNAWLKIYDVPVMYFPRFFHPDPTVDRKSGFLIPTIKNSPNSDNYLSVPYFSVLGINKDITLTPRFYADDKLLLQSEYRQVNKNSSHLSDLSILSEKNTGSRNHFFYKYNRNLEYFSFEESNLNLEIQQTSNDTYLKANKILTKVANDYDVLQSSLGLNFYSEDLAIDTEFMVYENLSKSNNDRYEYILPRLSLIKNIENKTGLNGNFYLKSDNSIKNYDTNVYESSNINDLIFNSNPRISNKGFYNSYDFILKNVNSDSQNSSNYKKDTDHYFSGLLQFNSSLPLLKETNNYQKIIKPKVTLKISPKNNTKNISKDVNRLDVNNVFNLNRLSSNNTVEGGLSLTYGNEYIISDKDNSNEIFSLKLANNLRLNENNDLPKSNQMGAKTSNFLGEIAYNPNKFLTTKYITSTKNNLYDVNYENFSTEIKINNFVTTFDYLNENDTFDKNSYLLNTTKYSFNKSNNISFSTRENKKTDLTEYYKLMYQYKNDCLSASIEYNKDYYNDRDIKPEESIFFKLTIIPFGETSSPDLKN